MQFKAYQHIERLGRPEVEGILSGNVYIFDKLDGSNVSIYLNDAGEIEVASRNRIVSPADDLRGVLAYVNANPAFKNFFAEHPNLRLFGEWLIPHVVRNYENDAWRKIYIFDVCDGDKYLRYEQYEQLLRLYGIDFIPVIAKLFNPTEELVSRYVDHCTFLISEGLGEGIVVKNYDFVNKFGHTVWAKVKIPKVAPLQKSPPTLPVDGVETQIIDSFLTPELIEKEFSKIIIDNGGEWNIKLFGKLLGCIWHAFISEETFAFIQKFHNPKIDFKLLNRLAVNKVKLVKAELF
ncbi:MAG: hypothetical protein IJT73_00690 [Selenomonadaceae bacterium]|nr:hypothetical protein [Selenomonadaceae bacterium]